MAILKTYGKRRKISQKRIKETKKSSSQEIVMKNFKEFFAGNQYSAPAILIGVAMMLTAAIVASSFDAFSKNKDSISVTGSSERYVKSDTAKLTINVSRRADSISDGTRSLQSDMLKLKGYLKQNGIASENISEGTVYSSPICQVGPQGYENCSLGTIAYNVNQTLIIESSDVDKMSTLQNQTASVLPGVNVSNSIEYFYNNLKNIRAEMLSEATRNAKDRADSVADAGGANIGKITSLSSGVFQVTAKNSVDYDGGGAYDTSSIEKKITATVRAEFSVK